MILADSIGIVAAEEASIELCVVAWLVFAQADVDTRLHKKVTAEMEQIFRKLRRQNAIDRYVPGPSQSTPKAVVPKRPHAPARNGKVTGGKGGKGARGAKGAKGGGKAPKRTPSKATPPKKSAAKPEPSPTQSDGETDWQDKEAKWEAWVRTRFFNTGGAVIVDVF